MLTLFNILIINFIVILFGIFIDAKCEIREAFQQHMLGNDSNVNMTESTSHLNRKYELNICL